MSSVSEIAGGLWSVRGELVMLGFAVGCVGILFYALTKVPAFPEPDQEDFMRIYERCLAAVPAGPQTTHYNDWAEVVSECKSMAYAQAKKTAPKG